MARRTLLRGAVALAAAKKATPAIARGEITPEGFGATGGDPEADTLGWRRALAEGARQGRPVRGQGTYLLRVSDESEPSWLGSPYPGGARIAVPLASNVSILGRDLTFCMAPSRQKPQPGERHFMFGTPLHAEPGALRDVTFEGVTFDFRDEWGRIYEYSYAIGVTGVDGFRRRDVRVVSTGKPAGRGLLTHNMRDRRDEGLSHRNIIQGIYARNETGVVMRDIAFDGFVEALDFDGPCSGVTLSRLDFRNGRGEAQCIDTAGGSDWAIEDVTAEDVGAILFVYFKPHGWPTYREWLASPKEPTATAVRPTDFRIRKIRGVRAGKEARKRQEAIRIGNKRPRNWPLPTMHPPGRISVADVQLVDGYQVVVNECEGLDMAGLELRNVAGPDDPSIGASLALRQDHVERGGLLTGRVRDVRVHDSPVMGVSAHGGSGLVLDRITVDGFNRGGGAKTAAGIRLRGLPGDMPRLGKAEVRGGPPGDKLVDAEEGSRKRR